jgi:hypothetical protein
MQRLIVRCSMYRTGYHLRIVMHWRGTPLLDVNTIVSLIGSTQSRAGCMSARSSIAGAIPPGSR